MKIEFCCEELANETGTYGMKFRHITRQGLWSHFEKEHLDTCPYCGSKIEITVRKEER